MMRFPTFLGLYFIILVRYFAFAGTAYYWWWIRGGLRTHRRKIDKAFPSLEIRRKEVLWSCSTSVVFALVGAILWRCWELGYTKVYLNIADHGLGYLVCSFLFLMGVHETYFYWTHRWMHRPKWFSRIHGVHHQSRNPTPWAAFSFHPWEAIIEAAIFPVFLFTIPIHPIALFGFLTTMTLLSVINHLGYEIYPKGFARHWLGQWMISATHHYLHHAKGKGNYGLYFTFWDRLLQTDDSRYPDLFDSVTSK